MTETMPVHVIRGEMDGPRLFISAAIHGDELNGIEIIRRFLNLPMLSGLNGAVIAVPVVNAYGLIHHSRYLADRCDLNRSFPGSEIGSVPSRIAWCFMEEIVRKCTHGIDLHTGGAHHSNLPQIRADMDNADTRSIALAFGAPVILNPPLREGSLRATATADGISTLVYEGGQALRFDEICIRTGVEGILNVLRELKMLNGAALPPSAPASDLARSSCWLKAPTGGLLRLLKPLGALAIKGDLLGLVDNLFDDNTSEIRALFTGIIIGRKEIPMVREGDAVFHLASVDEPEGAALRIQNRYGSAAAGRLPDQKNEPRII
jgi:predicted deacylase